MSETQTPTPEEFVRELLEKRKDEIIKKLLELIEEYDGEYLLKGIERVASIITKLEMGLVKTIYAHEVDDLITQGWTVDDVKILMVVPEGSSILKLRLMAPNENTASPTVVFMINSEMNKELFTKFSEKYNEILKELKAKMFDKLVEKYLQALEELSKCEEKLEELEEKPNCEEADEDDYEEDTDDY